MGEKKHRNKRELNLKNKQIDRGTKIRVGNSSRE
jgi:hypothetical protein